MEEKKQKGLNIVGEGMEVETEKGDLGEEDVSKPKVAEVKQDRHGNVEQIAIKKGVVFKKELDVPVDRVKQVAPGKGDKGKVVLDVSEKELEAMSGGGAEEVASEEEILWDNTDFIGEVERNIPTVEGMREIEEQASILRSRKNAAGSENDARAVQAGEGQQNKKVTWKDWLSVIGPGFIAGMAGNDSSAVASYAIDGSQSGFGHLWLLLLSTPLYQAVQFTCAKIGRITQKGMAQVLREHYGRPIAGLAALVLIIANVALVAADLVAIGSGFELLTHISWVWFVVPVAAVLWYLTVYRNFNALKKIFTVMSLAFVAYIVTAILARPNWSDVLFNTFVPHVDLTFASISSAVALLGATISPYNIFWQVQGEKEEQRVGTRKQKLRFAALDIGVGVVSGNLIAYFIIISTAATLFTHHKSISTAADAAQSMVGIIGPFGEYLFAIGLIGAGLVAIPVLLASTSYAVSGTFGWPVGLSKQPWQNEGFYLILTVALIASLVIALLRLNPISLLFWANILNGILAPVLVVLLLLIGNNRKIMANYRLHIATNIGLVLTFLIMMAATGLLIYGLVTGQG